MTTLGTRIRLARIARHQSQQQLGSAVGAHYQNVSAWERSISAPAAENLQKLCEVTGVAAHWLLHGTGWMFQPRTREAARELTDQAAVESHGLLILRYHTDWAPVAAGVLFRYPEGWISIEGRFPDAIDYPLAVRIARCRGNAATYRELTPQESLALQDTDLSTVPATATENGRNIDAALAAISDILVTSTQRTTNSREPGDVTTPCWVPLERLFSPQLCAKFMWIQRVHTGDETIECYKHTETRRYLNLDHHGQAYQFESDPRRHNEERYTPISLAAAIAHVLS